MSAMLWAGLVPAPCGTHHLIQGAPAYAERFDEVLKFHEPGLAPVKRDGLAWHIGPDGAAVYGRRFLRTFGFYDHLAAVSATDGWHHVRPDGEGAYAQRYAWCGNFQEGRCAVRRCDGSYGHVDRDGRCVGADGWRYAGDFRDGHAVVQGADGLSTHVDRAGQVTHGRWFLDLDVFHKGFARAQDVHGWHHVDAGGRALYRRRFASVEPFYNGQARVTRHDGGLEIVDEHGERVTELRPGHRCPGNVACIVL